MTRHVHMYVYGVLVFWIVKLSSDYLWIYRASFVLCIYDEGLRFLAINILLYYYSYRIISPFFSVRPSMTWPTYCSLVAASSPSVETLTHL